MATYMKTVRTILFLSLLWIGSAHINHAQEKKSFLRSGDLRLIKNRPYTKGDNPRQRLHLILPTSATNAPLPVLVHIHGGGWKSGEKADSMKEILPFLQFGHYAGVCVGYRLSTEAQWPAQIHDCKAAIRWIKANASTYNLDSTRIGVWGEPAGGHLAAMIGTSAGVPDMDGSLGPYTNFSTTVRCVVDNYGPTDLIALSEIPHPITGEDRNSATSSIGLLLGGPVDENLPAAAAASPINYVSGDAPPFLILHGTRDPIVPYSQSQLLHDALKAENVNSTMITVLNGKHGPGFGPEARKNIRRFFDHRLRGIRARWSDKTIRAWRPPSE